MTTKVGELIKKGREEKNLSMRQLQTGGNGGNEVLCQQNDVLTAFAQGREPQVQCTEAEIKVRAEQPLFHQFF